MVSFFLLTSSCVANDVIKYPLKLKMGYLANKLWHGRYWPLLKKIYNCILKMNFHASIVHSFGWRQHFLYGKYKNDVIYHRMTSSSWIKNRSMKPYGSFKRKLCTITYFELYNVGKYRKILPILHISWSQRPNTAKSSRNM